MTEAVAGEQKFENDFTAKVIDMIKEHNFKKMQVDKVEYLKPTKAALFALDLRFKNGGSGRNIFNANRSKKRTATVDNPLYNINS